MNTIISLCPSTPMLGRVLNIEFKLPGDCLLPGGSLPILMVLPYLFCFAFRSAGSHQCRKRTGRRRFYSGSEQLGQVDQPAVSDAEHVLSYLLFGQPIRSSFPLE